MSRGAPRGAVPSGDLLAMLNVAAATAQAREAEAEHLGHQLAGERAQRAHLERLGYALAAAASHALSGQGVEDLDQALAAWRAWWIEREGNR